MRVLYFAWVRQKIGKDEEDIVLPADVATITDLVTVLHARGAGYAEAFANPTRLRAARNQEHAGFDARLEDQDEVAFFPPVTGG